MDRLVYFLFRIFVACFSLLPFRILYGISDFICFVLYRVAGYRKKVVMQNLVTSFPGKSRKEIEAIANGFYHHLADLLIESLKAFSASEEEIVSRYRIKPSGFMEQVYHAGKSVIIVLGHYNNWEWTGLASGSQIIHKPVGFYKPMSNRYVNEFVRRTRVKGRSETVSVNDTIAVFKKDWGEPVGFGMIADQSPSSARLAYWVPFLNQDTATLHGPEKYARHYNLPVVYFDCRKIKRGYYEGEFLLLCDNPSETRTGEITAKFMKMLEESIRKNPEFYLWSHKRWKLRRSQ
jgi:KDO2-lipid IV(A) lauroyltransferase